MAEIPWLETDSARYGTPDTQGTWRGCSNRMGRNLRLKQCLKLHSWTVYSDVDIISHILKFEKGLNNILPVTSTGRITITTFKFRRPIVSIHFLYNHCTNIRQMQLQTVIVIIFIVSVCLTKSVLAIRKGKLITKALTSYWAVSKMF